MSTTTTAQLTTVARRPRTAAEVRRKRVQRARNFLIISALATLVAFAGHCLPGDVEPAEDGSLTGTTLDATR